MEVQPMSEQDKTDKTDPMEVLADLGVNNGFDAYQEQTGETAIYPGFESEETISDAAVTYTALGLNGEAGEVAEKVKKYLREGDEEYLNDLRDELGDVLWYLSRLADEVQLDLSYLAERNAVKLSDRNDRDVIEGEGDNR